ncbi:restriction endonuclease-like protein [Jeotgalibacillus salarius]|uniref:DUF2357 domain-containing protein n=1 Tax=Jeotgalibacillus salarius TaxID=546023 RepID=A0A4Y8LF81_9BACL|nr:restriction endonuclease-like protein [Jeotgalibacillus salarius]TFE01488.1 DUF2357 domain-containing protein [Jeotgalibacillus salarius]
MASPLSGLAKGDVELVKIETSDFSFVIKGKPYHEKYAGLQQYRTMDFHDEMQFRVVGDHAEIKVFDVEALELVDLQTHRPIFFENGIYTVMVSPKTDKELTFYHEHPIFRNAIDRIALGESYVLLGNLHFQNEIGYSTFVIKEGKRTLLEVTIEIFPTKLNYKEDYQKILDEVNDEIYNLAFHFLKKTYLSAQTKLEGSPSPTEFFRLITFYFETFIKAIEQIERQPHHKLVKTHEMVRGDRIKSLDGRGRNYLKKNSHLFQEVDSGIPISHRQYMPIKGINTNKQITFHTNENRFTKWMITRLASKLEDLLNRIQNNRWLKVDQDVELLRSIEGMKRTLTRKLNTPFYRELALPDRTVQSLVMQLAPGYRDAYQIYLTVSKGLALQNSMYKMSVKDIATLYEYWTYLKLGQILNKNYEMISQDIIKVNRKGLHVNMDANHHATRVYRHPVTKEKITLKYQKYEGNLPTIAQVPDTMLSIEKKGESYTFNYVFDAKYRIDFALDGSYYSNKYNLPGPMEEDINTMHRYRDSIVSEQNGPYERTAVGAYVLFPWNEEQLYQEHHFYKSIGKVNIGALPFLPNATDLVERFIENLIDKSPEEIQSEGILPRGSLQTWQKSMEEKVLVGVISSEDRYRESIGSAHYQIPVTILKRGWQEAQYVALYLTKEVEIDNGVVCYGKIKDVEVKGDRVTFKVDYWKHLNTVIAPVGYGIAQYMVTTLRSLENSTELPELFMKSEDEKVVWQMLKRVSDQINIGLDNQRMDEAERVVKYDIKGTTVIFNRELETLEIMKEDTVQRISFNEFRRDRVRVFRKLVD